MLPNSRRTHSLRQASDIIWYLLWMNTRWFGGACPFHRYISKPQHCTSWSGYAPFHMLSKTNLLVKGWGYNNVTSACMFNRSLQIVNYSDAFAVFCFLWLAETVKVNADYDTSFPKKETAARNAATLNSSTDRVFASTKSVTSLYSLTVIWTTLHNLRQVNHMQPHWQTTSRIT